MQLILFDISVFKIGQQILFSHEYNQKLGKTVKREQFGKLTSDQYVAVIIFYVNCNSLQKTSVTTQMT